MSLLARYLAGQVLAARGHVEWARSWKAAQAAASGGTDAP